MCFGWTSNCNFFSSICRCNYGIKICVKEVTESALSYHETDNTMTKETMIHQKTEKTPNKDGTTFKILIFVIDLISSSKQT